MSLTLADVDTGSRTSGVGDVHRDRLGVDDRLVEHCASRVRDGEPGLHHDEAPQALITHRMPLEEIADGYRMFEKKLDGVIKIVLVPNGQA